MCTSKQVREILKFGAYTLGSNINQNLKVHIVWRIWVWPITYWFITQVVHQKFAPILVSTDFGIESSKEELGE